MVVLRADPLNCETPVSALIGGTVMPNARFYVRNHFTVPTLDPKRWRLRVGGLVSRPQRLGLSDLLAMPSQATTVTMECAGNGRAFLAPNVDGEQWGLGAVSTAEWTGVPLVDVLDRAAVKAGARELVFRGGDTTAGQAHRFERSLTLADARRSEALLAYAMNGEPLPRDHGYPLRLIVPGWYGVASVKWLTEIDVIGEAFSGYFQTEKYVYEFERDGRVEREPVRVQRVRALITQPADGDAVNVGPVAIRGLAWSGAAPIERVAVSVDGSAWRPARLVGECSRHEWQRWELIANLERIGRVTIRARATDAGGLTQPEQAEWNRLGYGNNAIRPVEIQVRGRTPA